MHNTGILLWTVTEMLSVIDWEFDNQLISLLVTVLFSDGDNAGCHGDIMTFPHYSTSNFPLYWPFVRKIHLLASQMASNMKFGGFFDNMKLQINS